jgi:hypothetical protein
MLRFQGEESHADCGVGQRGAIQAFENLSDGIPARVAALPCEVNPAFSTEVEPDPDPPAPNLVAMDVAQEFYQAIAVQPQVPFLDNPQRPPPNLNRS